MCLCLLRTSVFSDPPSQLFIKTSQRLVEFLLCLLFRAITTYAALTEFFLDNMILGAL